jgi:hypothetical protein
MEKNNSQPVTTPVTIEKLRIQALIERMAQAGDFGPEFMALEQDLDCLLYMENDPYVKMLSDDELESDDEYPEPPVRRLPSGEIPRKEGAVPSRLREGFLR